MIFFNRLISLLLLSCLIVDPALARPVLTTRYTVSRLKYRIPSAVVFSSQAVMPRGAYFHSLFNSLAARAGWHLLCDYFSGSDSLENVDGFRQSELAGDPGFSLSFSKKNNPVRQDDSPRFTRRQLGFGAALGGGLLALGGWLGNKLGAPSSEDGVPLQTVEQLEILRKYVAGLRLISMNRAGDAEKVLAAARLEALAARDAALARRMEEFSTRIRRLLKERPTAVDSRETWFAAYLEVIQDFNDAALVPRGWLLVPSSERSLMRITKIKDTNWGDAAHTAADGTRSAKTIPIYSVEPQGLSDGAPGEKLGGAIYFGLPSRPVFVVDVPSLKADDEFHQALLDALSPESTSLQGTLEWLRQGYLKAFEKDQAVVEGRLTPEFISASHSELLLHETTHAFNSGARLGLRNEDEAFAHLTGLTGKTPFMRLAKITFGAWSQITFAVRRGERPLDRAHPFEGSYLILAAVALADALNDHRLADQIAEFDANALRILQERLMTLGRSELAAIAEKARQQVGSALPAHGTFQLTIRDTPPSAGAQTKPAVRDKEREKILQLEKPAVPQPFSDAPIVVAAGMGRALENNDAEEPAVPRPLEAERGPVFPLRLIDVNEPFSADYSAGIPPGVGLALKRFLEAEGYSLVEKTLGRHFTFEEIGSLRALPGAHDSIHFPFTISINPLRGDALGTFDLTVFRDDIASKFFRVESARDPRQAHAADSQGELSRRREFLKGLTAIAAVWDLLRHFRRQAQKENHAAVKPAIFLFLANLGSIGYAAYHALRAGHHVPAAYTVSGLVTWSWMGLPVVIVIFTWLNRRLHKRLEVSFGFQPAQKSPPSGEGRSILPLLIFVLGALATEVGSRPHLSRSRISTYLQQAS